RRTVRRRRWGRAWRNYTSVTGAPRARSLPCPRHLIRGPHERLAPVTIRPLPRPSGQAARHPAHGVRAVAAALGRPRARVPAGARPVESLLLGRVDPLRGARARRTLRGGGLVRGGC